MQDIANASKSYLDFAGLGDLKVRAKTDQSSAAKEVGQQFEAMFVQMIFKSMRQANEPLKDGLFGSNTEDSYEQMYHQELAQVMSQTGAFGLGDWLTNQVTGQTNPTKAIQAYEETPREA
ncbi:MAG: rod-binding protein, partial [Porticoccaceae bacterium]|nr:rod-binding protein [Porticoccaceae bacterium]